MNENGTECKSDKKGFPIIAFVFSFLYRIATDVAEENNLTI